ncbi:MAG: sigma-70 family RNA polymerase sigma factor [Myxococcales bacterium]|nr:sigma-70 family RNA polymerase sigma factor [Myxococcales bacterium]MCB9701288.1 sigma-70 family RNA polymerase sigma factor [Myxococcales bacterium]
MPAWTADRLSRALTARERGELNELARHLIPAVVVGRAILLSRKPYLQGNAASKEDDVQEVLVGLFRDDARLLRNFDPAMGKGPEEEALRRFVIGVTWNVLQRAYQKRRVRWEALEDDLAGIDHEPGLLRGLAGFCRVIDLERAVEALSEGDRALFSMIYVEQREQTECCAHLGISENTFQARKSRLLRRLRGLLDDRAEAPAMRRAHG